MKRVQVLTEPTTAFASPKKTSPSEGPATFSARVSPGLPSLAFADLVGRAAHRASRELADDSSLAIPRCRSGQPGLKKLVLERYAARLALTAAG